MCFAFGSFPFFKLLGGLNLTWYDRPDDLCTHRPQIRSSNTASGTCSSITRSTASPFFASTSSNFLACSTVLGNPSRMKPLVQSFSEILSAIIPHTISSVTKAPASIAALACFPTVVPAATAALNMSPVDNCGVPNFVSIFGACVPLPAPGGPNRIRILRAFADPLKVISATDVVTFLSSFAPVFEAT